MYPHSLTTPCTHRHTCTHTHARAHACTDAHTHTINFEKCLLERDHLFFNTERFVSFLVRFQYFTLANGRGPWVGGVQIWDKRGLRK